MPVLETSRLTIFPLTLDQVKRYLQPGNALEQSLGLAIHPRSIPPELAEALEATILPAVAAAEGNAILFSTIWTIVLKESNMMIGDMCFKGAPAEDGSVEIGYGTYEAFQNKGYMTEAVQALTHWALQQPGVTKILAETEKENIASHKTLIKNQFRQNNEKGTMLWWVLEK